MIAIASTRPCHHLFDTVFLEKISCVRNPQICGRSAGRRVILALEQLVPPWSFGSVNDPISPTQFVSPFGEFSGSVNALNWALLGQEQNGPREWRQGLCIVVTAHG